MLEFTAIDDIEGIHAKIHLAFDSGKTRSFEWRRAQLRQLKDLLVENEDALANAMHEDLGRCLCVVSLSFHAVALEQVSSSFTGRKLASSTSSLQFGKWITL